MITRRQLLRLGALAAGSRLGRYGSLNSLAAEGAGDYKALVCVFLFGGNDANNMVVPLSAAGYTDYAKARGEALALPQNSLLPVATASGDPYGFHPRCTGIQQLYLLKKLAVVANLGTLVRPLTAAQYRQGNVPVPQNLFSHSDQQSQWQSAPAPNSIRNGWGGRMADALLALNSGASFPPGVSTAGNSLFLAGQNTTAATVTGGGLGLAGSSEARDAAFEEILNFDSGLTLVQRSAAITREGIRVGKELNATLEAATALKTEFPQTDLGNQLSEVARILKVRSNLGMQRQIFFVAHGGYDTHTAQLAQHAELLGELSSALRAFYDATVELGLESQVTTFTESEFGRTFQPSTGAGSDHAWGSHQIVMGGAVKGGEVYGKFPTLRLNGPDDVSSRGVWLPTTSLDQYAAPLATWFGVDDTQLQSVLPNLANFKDATKLAFL